MTRRQAVVGAPLVAGVALLTYSLLAPDWRRTLLRAGLWWPLPLALLEAWR